MDNHTGQIVTSARRAVSWQKNWWIPILFTVILLTLAACKEESGPAASLTAECNPAPVNSPALPAIVASIDYLGPEVNGPVHSLKVEGDRVYLGLGDSFAILDVSDPAEPVLIGSTPLNGRSPLAGFSNFTVQDNLAYFSQTNDDYTIDLSDPESPVLVRCRSAVPWPDAAQAFNGRYFISNSSLGGIRIVERPLRRSTEVEIASYTTQTPPELEWDQPPGQWVPLPSFSDTDPMYVRNYTFDNRYLYMLNVLRIPGDYCCGALTILDLENPAEPGHISTTQIPAELAPFSVMVAEDYLFINVSEPRGYNPNIMVYDISNKRRPELLTTVPGFTLPRVNNGYAYFPGTQGIDIWELDGKDGPVLVGRIDIPGITDVETTLAENRMVFVGEHIYLGTGETLAILNNEDQTNPYLADQLAFPPLADVVRLAGMDGRLAGVTNLALADRVEVLPLGEEMWQALPGQQVVYRDIAVDGNQVIAIEQFTGQHDTVLHHFDLAATPIMTAEVMIQDFEGQRVAVVYPYIYLLQPSTETPMLRVVDISDPNNAVEVLEIALEWSFYQDVAVWEESLYVASTGQNGAVRRFDISEPDRPVLVARLPFDLLSEITVGDGFLFGLNVTNQVEVIDLRPSTGPVLVGRYDIERANAMDLYYEDGVLYLALGERGVAAVQLDVEGD